MADGDQRGMEGWHKKMMINGQLTQMPFQFCPILDRQLFDPNGGHTVFISNNGAFLCHIERSEISVESM